MQKPYNKVSIALDYDGTVTSDPLAFLSFINLFRSRGHKVYIVTMRYESECLSDQDFLKIASYSDGYYATGREPKKTYMIQQNVDIHIWIDDNPIAVYKSATEIWGQASPEGTVVTEVHRN